nr:23S rRNA (uracil(1939)-C(5))-methyltransferase RlmD [Lachnospiraceae bacterium]
MKKGQEYTGSVSTIRFPNKGVVTTQDGEKCIVKNVIPGQKIRFRVTKKRNGTCEGMLLEVIERSSAETDSFCPHFESCGGCTYQTLPYEKQLQIKEEQVHELLEPVLEGALEGQVDIKLLFEKIIPSPTQFEYRNKMEFSFGDASYGGELELGLHKIGSFYDIVTVKNCRIVDEDFRLILKETLSYFRGKETPYFHKRTHEGFLRFLLVRKAAKTGQILIDLVTTSQTPPDTMCTEISLLDDWKEAMLSLGLSGSIAGILHTIDDGVADAISNDRTDILFGQDRFDEEVLGLIFKISPFSFFQTNTLSAEVLYSKIREYAQLTGSEEGIVFDLYSGTGTIGQLMSTAAKEVVGVEIVEEAVRAANENSEINGLHNCRFIAGDVLCVLDEIESRPDLIILDPPRDGVNPKALKKIARYGVDYIIYVSCKPTSLARDLLSLMEDGYRPIRICPIDQFPGTVHVETCVLLGRESGRDVKYEYIDYEPKSNPLKRDKVSYAEIKAWIGDKYGLKVS